MMTILAKLIVGVNIALAVNSIDIYKSIDTNTKLTEIYPSNYSIKNSKVNAFQILDNKWNVCNHKRNKRRVFTSENMDTWASDIYKQVFVKKQIPKGKKNHLL